MEAEVVIGGRSIALRKGVETFNVVAPGDRALDDVKAIAGITGVTRLARGLWGVRVADPLARDIAMAAVRERGIVAHHTYEIVGDELGSTLTLTDLLNLRLMQEDDLESLCSEFGLAHVRTLAGSVQLCQVTWAARANPLKVLQRLVSDPRIEFAEPDFLISFDRMASAGGTSELSGEWHLHGTTARFGMKDLPNVHSQEAWQVTTGDAGIVIAVMDDGFDLTNPDLETNVQHPCDFTRRDVAGTAPLVPDDELPYPDQGRGDFHGTPCAGLAIARGIANVSGVAPGCSWMPVRFDIASSSQSLVLAVFEYISSRADVVSCSWGITPTGYPNLSTTAAQVVATLARSGGRRGRGLVFCLSAGNNNLPTFLSAAANERGLEYYGSTGNVLGHFFKNKDVHGGWTELPGMIVVGSLTAQRRKALYSNWGPHLTLCAPSDNWHPSGVRTRPQFNSLNLVTTDNLAYGLGLKDVGLSEVDAGAYTYDMGGTSGAAPIVAGVCGLILSVFPDASATTVCEILARTADKDLDFSLDVAPMYNNEGQSGAFDASGHSIWFGYGLVNAAAAVTLASTMRGD